MPPSYQRPSFGSAWKCLLVALTVSAAAALLHYWQAASWTSLNLTLDERPVSELMAATATRIAEESRDPEGSPPPVARSAPVSRQDSGTVAENVYAANLPQGYSFVDFEGEMAKAPLGVRRIDAPAHNLLLDWLGTPTAVEALAAQAAAHGREWSFGWIQLAADARHGDLASSLASSGVVIVGSSGRLLRARLPVDERHLADIARLPGVDALGAMPVEARLRAFDDRHVPDHEPTPVFVTLMEDDSDGRWRRELVALGAVVGRYHPDLRVYETNADGGVLDGLGRADFVLAVEPVGTVEAAHDTAVPAMGADALRLYEGTPGLFSGVGGASVPIGVMDTGLNIKHPDIASNRSSICGANFVDGQPLLEDDDLWVDANGHGSHVTGTIVGNGAVQPRYAGMAPQTRDIRFAKVLDHRGFGQDRSIFRGMDFLAKPTACPQGGWSPDAVKPLIVNMSLARTQRVWRGRTVAERKLDSIVWSRRQLYVVAQSNADIHGFSNFAASKNSLAVGAVTDSGELALFSSHGPTVDGRLAPQIVGAGVDVHSAAGDGSHRGYDKLSGTSMASPAVAGLATLLMDAVPAHRERPALARARLMASAVKPDVWLEDREAFPADNSNGPGMLQTQYGLGKASARTSVLDRDQPDGWRSSSSVSVLEDNEYAWVDIDVPADASRLDLVLAWDEPPADTIAGAVLNDLDLWLDHGADCEPEPCGEYASTSRVDNVEWLVVRNPTPGTHRAKVAASRVYTESPRAALAWTVIRGSSTPDLEITLEQELLTVERLDEEKKLTLGLKANSYVAAGTRLHIDCRSVNSSLCTGQLHVSSEREDGITQQIEASVGTSFDVGELGAGETKDVTITFGNLAGEGADAFRLYFKASAWNANAASTSVLVRTSGAGDSDMPETPAPTNDRFSIPMSIKGAEGRVPVTLLRAITEPGEPSFTYVTSSGYEVVTRRPAGSVWHSWTSPLNGRVSFSVTPQGALNADESGIGVEVFRGDRITGLERIETGQYEVSFFAESDQTYLIRVGHVRGAVPLLLNWSSGPRPVNDDFAAASVLEDASGSVEGTNAGATLESDEFFGLLASTTWYRWTAPTDGSWKFESSLAESRVLAFTGEHLRDLRLVSGVPSRAAVFPAEGGQVYWIAVGSEDAFAGGQAYELEWFNFDLPAGSNDDFGSAQEIRSGVESHSVEIEPDSTVQPGEPAGSGIRTKWWTWTALSEGRYVWRFDVSTLEREAPLDRLMVSVFTGEALDDMQLVATNGEWMSLDFNFRAEAGRRYWISSGFPTADPWAFSIAQANATLAWGAAPQNDDMDKALAIMGASGSVSGSNAFATNMHGERSVDVGRSALWYAWEASASAFFSFTLEGDGGPWALTVYRDALDGSGLEMVASNHMDGNEANVSFHASKGVRYLIAVGVRAGGSGGEFTLQWDVSDPTPVRHAGRLADGDLVPRGNPGEVLLVKGLAMHPDGTALYLATNLGMHVFKRDQRTGRLDLAQVLVTDHSVDDAVLTWDARRNRLLVSECWWWQVLAPVGEGPELKYLWHWGEGDPGCPTTVLMDGTGSDLYRYRPHDLRHFRLDSEGAIRHIGEYDVAFAGDILWVASAAVLSNDGRYIYVAGQDLLQVFERNPESGELAKADYESAIDLPPRSTGSIDRAPLAITHDDAHLFVGEDHESIAVYSLQDRSNPRRLATLEQPRGDSNPPQRSACVFADTRPESVIVDVFCDGLVVSAKWDPEAGELKGEYWLPPSLHLDDFIITKRGLGVAASPDGRYLYVSTEHNHSIGIDIFTRDGIDGADPLVARTAVTSAK